MTAVELLIKQLMNFNIGVENNGSISIEQLKEIEKQQIKDAYNQGYREGLQDCNCEPLGDVAKYSNADDYYKETYDSI
jgi:hypothetical protein